MKDRIDNSRIVKWLERWSPTLFGPLIVGVVIAVVLSTAALVRTNRESEERSRQVEFQLVQQRDTFCGFVQPIAEAGKAPNPAPTTKTGRSVVAGAENTSIKLQCTPDPYDGK